MRIFNIHICSSLLLFLNRPAIPLVCIMMLLPQQAVAFKSTMEYYYYDRQGSLLEVYDSNSRRLLSQAWSPWGERQVLHSVASGGGTKVADLLAHGLPVRIGYTGHKELLATGLTFAGDTRLYDAKLKRFLNSDDRTTGGVRGQNRYAYAYNNPMRYVDPDGRAPKQEKECAEPAALPKPAASPKPAPAYLAKMYGDARNSCTDREKQLLRDYAGYKWQIPVYCVSKKAFKSYPILTIGKDKIDKQDPARGHLNESNTNCYAAALGGALGAYDPSKFKSVSHYKDHNSTCRALIKGAKLDGAIQQSTCPPERPEMRFYVSRKEGKLDYHVIWDEKGKWMQKTFGLPRYEVQGEVSFKTPLADQSIIVADGSRATDGTYEVGDVFPVRDVGWRYLPCATGNPICGLERIP